SVAILLFIVYWITLSELDHQLRQSVEREADVLVDLYRERGADTAVRAIQLRAADLRAPRRYYLLQDREGRRLAGNLQPTMPIDGPTTLPVSALSRDKSARTATPGNADPVVAVGRILENGDFLLVGENRYRAVKAREAIGQALVWGFIVTLVLALGGGVALGMGFMRRIEAINRTTRSIMEGDFSQRVPTSGGVDE